MQRNELLKELNKDLEWEYAAAVQYVQRLMIDMAETYDVVIAVPEEGSHEFRATERDSSGRVAGLYNRIFGMRKRK